VIRRLVLVLGLIWPGVTVANDWDALETPGAFAIMRHALAPGTGDPAGFDVTNCATQRNLDERGREQARRIGEAFSDRGHSFDVVLTSQWCRCRDTADLLDLGPVEEVPAFNSFFQDFSTRDSQTAEAGGARGSRRTSVRRHASGQHQRPDRGNDPFRSGSCGAPCR
jgi:hypothetical protein